MTKILIEKSVVEAALEALEAGEKAPALMNLNALKDNLRQAIVSPKALDVLVDTPAFLTTKSSTEIEKHKHCDCKNPNQCWEPCGELGHSAEHVKVHQTEQRKCDNCGEFGECCQQPKQEQELDPVHEYRKGFIAGQLDMRDRPEEQQEQGEPVALDVILDFDEAKILYDQFGDDREYLSPVRLIVGDGHSGYGLYAAQAEYQDEGVVLVASITPPVAPAKPEHGGSVAWNEDQAYAWGRGCYEIAQGATTGWKLFGQLTPKEQAYWVAKAAFEQATPQQRKPLTDEQAAFESVFKLPANCTKFEGGYAPTSYNAWDAQTFCARWEGWKARAAHGIAPQGSNK